MMNNMIKVGLGLLATTTLVACGGGNSPEPMQTLRITMTNLTAGQPISPVMVALNTGATAWSAGAVASTALEKLAESGDASALAASLAAAGGLGAANGKAPIGPGASESIELSFNANAAAKLTLAGMLVNTNDAFTGLAAVSVGGLAVGEQLTQQLAAWDAGTEANDETAATIPGPAGGGEGFNAARSDGLNLIRVHAGVVSADDGLATSVLKSTHRFDNPVLGVLIERIR
ncbi:MAG: hypothetical protein COW02_15940 [Comamonadaceae bacterium CG12_big_fil_rev_8_21_14_0_65_59_15]|nr:MAG: hypothetical protein COW02_15940 [Comamonadaceae bacterium CG12_big_fil_rev_8_21_14_0_65_59_15]